MKACDYCKEDAKDLHHRVNYETKVEEYVYIWDSRIVIELAQDNWGLFEIMRPINYCPMCGRKLEE